MSLSDVFKFTQGLGQKGHQIGRKVGDAIELLVWGMINKDEILRKHLIVEDKVEGISGAKHKVEFCFYKLNDQDEPSRSSLNLFGIIECKKVGVEQTIKSDFKTWKRKSCNNINYCETEGYNFTISLKEVKKKWKIHIKAKNEKEDNNLELTIKETSKGSETTTTNLFRCDRLCQLLIGVDIDNELHVLDQNQKLSDISKSIKKCVIIEINKLNEDGLITSINVNESLPGPQTPEKAKQASFVSLDIRKKVANSFEKLTDKTFTSVLVIGEVSHWETKSRSIIKLYNDYNLIIPDSILVYFFEEFEKKLNIPDYQTYITKTKYKTDANVRAIVSDIVNHFEGKILKDMETDNFVELKHGVVNGTDRLLMSSLQT